MSSSTVGSINGTTSNSLKRMRSEEGLVDQDFCPITSRAFDPSFSHWSAPPLLQVSQEVQRNSRFVDQNSSMLNVALGFGYFLNGQEGVAPTA